MSEASEPDREASSFWSGIGYGRQALSLVWATSPTLTVFLGALTVVSGALPAAIAFVGQLIVDSVVTVRELADAERTHEAWSTMVYIGVEGVLVAVLAATQRGISVIESLLRAQLGHRVNVMILEKALELQLADFEDSEFYDKLVRARRDASIRPLSLVNRTFRLTQHVITLMGLAGLLWRFSPLAVMILALAGVPAFIAEAKFSGDAFRLFRWRSPETRQLSYLEAVLAREDHAKEVQLYNLGSLLLSRYKAIFARLYKEDRRLTLRRGIWGFGLGLLGTLSFYGAYVWIGMAAMAGGISLGEMTMYLMVFKQGQSAVSAGLSSLGGMYEDNLYLSNLYEYLEQPTRPSKGRETVGPRPEDGVRFENVSFTYPGMARPALSGVNFHLRPGESLALVGKNGSGKTTLIKLLTRLYVPTSGRITLDGLDIEEWDPQVLRRRIGVIFQDFARYQMLVGENIGAGDASRFDDERRWKIAAERAMADDFVGDLKHRYHTQLGRWFRNGQELSGGQWQKVALARAFMRADADIFVLDEPTAAMDAEAEAAIFGHFRAVAKQKMTVLISHRFSTVRVADHIVVIENGTVVEQGDHASLMAQDGKYARLFSLQAQGYR